MSGPGPLNEFTQKASTAISSLLGSPEERDPVRELQNLALDEKLLGLVVPLLEEVGYKVEPDTMISRSGESRPVTVGKKGEEKKFYLVRVPGWILEQADDKNQAAVALLSYFFGKNSRLYITASDLGSIDLAFELMITEEWKESKNITAVCIPWSHLLKASTAKTVQQRLIFIKKAFRFEGELSAVSPSPNGGSGTTASVPAKPENGSTPATPAPENPARNIPVDLNLKPDDIDALVDIMATRAASPLQPGPKEYLRNLVSAAYLPKKYLQTIDGRFQGNAEADSRALINDLIDKKINSKDPRYTMLGSIVMALLKQDTSPDDARTMVAILRRYGLILDDKERERLAVRFMLPELATPEIKRAAYGPDIDWLGPEEAELQSFLRPEPPWLDVGFLRKAMERSSAICRVEVGTRTGTGFLVASNLVLTNYHVLVFDSQDNLEENAHKAALRFGCFSTKSNDPSEGQVFRLGRDPIVEQSPVNEHDFLLLRVEDAIRDEEAITPAPLEPSIPTEKSALNIIHHPFGETMKLSLSGNGVTGIYEDKGLLQYVTRAAEGSSGSPCFNDDWKVVGLHHAQRARSFGSIREGILIQAIYEQIQKHLD